MKLKKSIKNKIKERKAQNMKLKRSIKNKIKGKHRKESTKYEIKLKKKALINNKKTIRK